MKKKWMLFVSGIVLIGIIVIIIFFAGDLFGEDEVSSKMERDQLVSVGDRSNVYYWNNASRNTVFHLYTPNSAESSVYTLRDSEGNMVEVNQVESANGFWITGPDGGYKPDERYTLELLENVSFFDEELIDVQTLVFSVEKDAVEKFSFSSEVKEQSGAIKEISGNRIEMKNVSAEVGDIVFGKNVADDYVAYKIDQIHADGTATVSIPSIDEIYDDIEIYGDYTFDPSAIVMEEELEAEIIINLKESTFFESLITTVYAAESAKEFEVETAVENVDLEITITAIEDSNELEVEIKICLSPDGDDMLGIEGFSEHKVILTLNYIMGVTSHVDINDVSKWDISATVSTNFSWHVDIEYCLLNSTGANFFLDEAPYNEYKNKFLKEVVKKLSESGLDEDEVTCTLFSWPLLISPIPGFGIDLDVDLFLDFGIYANGSIGEATSCTYTVGLMLYEGEFIPYSDGQNVKNSYSVSIGGKVEAKAGVKFNFVAEVINENIAYIATGPKIGGYAEAFVTGALGGGELPSKITGDGYFEAGILVAADIEAYINFAIEDMKFTYTLLEERWPCILIGCKEMPIGITLDTEEVVIVDGQINVPVITFEYYSVEECEINTRMIDFEELEFWVEDEVMLEKCGSGQVLIPEEYQDRETLPVTVKYTCENGDICTGTFNAINEDVIPLGGQEIDAINALLDGLDSNDKEVSQWSEEEICRAIYGKLNRGYNLSYLEELEENKSQLSGGYGYKFALADIQKLTYDMFGRDYPVVEIKACGISCENDSVIFVPAFGEGRMKWKVQSATKQGDVITSIGSALWWHHNSPEFRGSFVATLAENPGSTYGYTLLSLRYEKAPPFESELVASASSELDEGYTKHSASNVLDGDVTTSWVEGVSGVGRGEWLMVETEDGSQMSLSGITLRLGYQKSTDLMEKNGIPTIILIEAENGFSMEVDHGVYVRWNPEGTILFDKVINTSWLRITILDAEAGSLYDDTCISEVELHSICSIE